MQLFKINLCELKGCLNNHKGNCSLDKINKIFPKIKHLFEKKDGYLICPQAEEDC